MRIQDARRREVYPDCFGRYRLECCAVGGEIPTERVTTCWPARHDNSPPPLPRLPPGGRACQVGPSPLQETPHHHAQDHAGALCLQVWRWEVPDLGSPAGLECPCRALPDPCRQQTAPLGDPATQLLHRLCPPPPRARQDTRVACCVRRCHGV